MCVESDIDSRFQSIAANYGHAIPLHPHRQSFIAQLAMPFGGVSVTAAQNGRFVCTLELTGRA
jgi:hypothetical protein